MTNKSIPRNPADANVANGYVPLKAPKMRSLISTFSPYEYEKGSVFIPFNLEMSNKGLFPNPKAAMQYIHMHCIKFYGKFDKQLATRYADYCKIIFLNEDGYILLSELPKKGFNKLYEQEIHLSKK